MKKASKIFIIISIVVAGIALLVGGGFIIKCLTYKIFNDNVLNDLIIGIILIAISLAPLIIGVKALKKLEEAVNRNDLIVIGIITLIFCSFLGGLFMLIMQDSDLK